MTPTWTTALPDWERRIVARESMMPVGALFPSYADAAWAVASELRLKDVSGQKLGDVALPWMKEFFYAVFGAYDEEAGRRHINEFFWMVSKKNAKSTMAAAIMLTATIMNWREAAELLILSPTKEVADNSYKPARDMIKANEVLDEMFQVQDHLRTITHREMGVTLKVVAASSETVSGKKASFVFVDELHEFGMMAGASNMLLEATGGLTSRPEGFVIYATTQSAKPPAGVFRDKLAYARKVRDGEIVNPQFLPLIYEFPAAMIKAGEHKDLTNAYVTNPNWGTSVDIQRVRQLHSQASAAGENDFLEFLAKHLNVEIGLNLRSDRWAGADYWEAAGTEGLSIEALIERCEVLVVGIDGGGMDDMLGVAVMGRDARTGDWLTWGRAWVHRIVLERRKEIAPRLVGFERDGDLVVIDDDSTEDVEAIANLCERLHETGLLAGIGVDPVGIGAILDALEERGIPRELVQGISQGWKMAGAIKTMERKLAAHQMWHGGRPLMAWCVSNAKVEPRGNAILITKQAAGTAKIDPVSALINAAELMTRNPEGRGSIDGWLEQPLMVGRAA